MTSAPESKPFRSKRRTHRHRLGKRGLRAIRIWVPDVHTPAFRAAARRQSLAVAASPLEPEDQAFIDAVSDPGV